MLDGKLQYALPVILIPYQKVLARFGLESTRSFLWVPSPTSEEEFVLLPQMLPSGTRVLSEDENEERLDNLRARIYLDPPVERNCFSQNLIVNTVLGDKFKDGLFVLLYNNGTTKVNVRKILCNDRNVYCPWKFVLLHRHVTLDTFHRGNECFPTVATAAAVCLNYLTVQSLIAHNNRRLVTAGLPESQSPNLPV